MEVLQLMYALLDITEYAGLEITDDSAVALRTLKTEMLVPVKHWSLWEENSFSALPSGRAYSGKDNTPI